MKEYIVSFIFEPGYKKVWLIEKQKPEWQKGCLNGIGGKVEKNESYKKAAIRELKEEAGVFIGNLLEVGHMIGTNNDHNSFKVVIFTAVTGQTLKTMEDEKIHLVGVNETKQLPHVENVPLLIESCLYFMRGKSNFSKLIMKY